MGKYHKRKSKGARDRPRQRSVRQAPGHVQELVEMRLKLREVFQELGWDSPREQDLFRMLGDPTPSTRYSVLNYHKVKTNRAILRVMRRDPDQKIKQLAKKFLKELGEPGE